MKRAILTTVVLFTTVGFSFLIMPSNKNEGFVPLFNGIDWSGWYLKIRNGDEELAKKLYAIEDGSVHICNDDFPSEYELNTGKNATHGLLYTEEIQQVHSEI